MQKRFRLALVAALSFFALLVFGATVGPLALKTAVAGTSIPALPEGQGPSQVLDREGALLGVIPAAEYREPLRLEEVSNGPKQAIIAAEDRSFPEHEGVSWPSLARAFVSNTFTDDSRQGGSTISMQYAKRLLGNENQRTYANKWEEALLARKLHEELPPDEILLRYINAVYFGRGAYGMQAAAHAYFGRPLSELSYPHWATLAAVIKEPSFYGGDDPAVPERLLDRRNYVLDGMLETGAINNKDVLASYKAEPLGIVPRPDFFRPSDPCFRHVLDEVEGILRGTFEVGDARVEQGGLTVRTTIDHRQQLAACAALDNHLSRTEGPSAGLVAIDPATGGVRAMASSKDFSVKPFNYAFDGLGWQVGSAMKPFVLAATLERHEDNGITLQTPIPAPACMTFDGVDRCNGGRASYPSGITPLDALRYSVNTAHYWQIQEVGPQTVADLAHKMGASDTLGPTDRAPDLDPVPSLALGTSPMTPYEYACAFTPFVQGGEHRRCHLLAEVTDQEGVLFLAQPEVTQPLTKDAADATAFAMRQVLSPGGTAADNAIDRPAAGKTGTSQDNTSAWFGGGTPDLVAAVGMGHDTPGTKLPGIGGGDTPAAIWEQFMRKAHEGLPVTDFDPPPSYLTDLPWSETPAPAEPDRSEETEDTEVAEEHTATPEVEESPPLPEPEEPAITEPPAPEIAEEETDPSGSEIQPGDEFEGVVNTQTDSL